MDIFYYSNYCKHSQRVLQSLVKGNVSEKISFICIDKRVKDPKTNQIYIVSEQGKYILLPPNIQSVPSLLVSQQKYKVILGDDILKHYHPLMKIKNERVNSLGEPSGFALNQIGYFSSEKYTDYNLSPEELSAKGNGKNRQLYNYVSVNEDIILINTPDEKYQPDKVSGSITVDVLQQKRMDEMTAFSQTNSIPFL
jgi:hypothetical protein